MMKVNPALLVRQYSIFGGDLVALICAVFFLNKTFRGPSICQRENNFFPA